MRSVTTHTLGFHRNNKRVWLNNRHIRGAGFSAGNAIKCVYQKGQVELIKSDNCANTIKVANTKKGEIIDLNNKELTKAFEDFSQVEVVYNDGRIVIRGQLRESKIIDREEQLKQRVERGEALRKGGLFVGIGLLCRSVERGIKKSGVAVKTRFANELDSIPSEINISANEIWENNEDGEFVHGDIFDLNMRELPKLDLLVMGNPCTPFSRLNTHRIKEKRSDVFHEAGTVFQPILEVINATNPGFVLMENSCL